jgi:hypothetical protein
MSKAGLVSRRLFGMSRLVQVFVPSQLAIGDVLLHPVELFFSNFALGISLLQNLQSAFSTLRLVTAWAILRSHGFCFGLSGSFEFLSLREAATLALSRRGYPLSRLLQLLPIAPTSSFGLDGSTFRLDLDN